MQLTPEQEAAHRAAAEQLARDKAALRAAAAREVETHKASTVIAGREHWMVITVPEKPVAGAPMVLYFNRNQSENLKWVVGPGWLGQLVGGLKPVCADRGEGSVSCRRELCMGRRGGQGEAPGFSAGRQSVRMGRCRDVGLYLGFAATGL